MGGWEEYGELRNAEDAQREANVAKVDSVPAPHTEGEICDETGDSR